MNRRECPECGHHDTNRQHVERRTSGNVTVRTCPGCGAEFENHLQITHKETTYTPPEEGA